MPRSSSAVRRRPASASRTITINGFTYRTTAVRMGGAFYVPLNADKLSFTHRKEWMRWVEDAKTPETRATRIEKTVAGLTAGKKTH